VGILNVLPSRDPCPFEYLIFYHISKRLSNLLDSSSHHSYNKTLREDNYFLIKPVLLATAITCSYSSAICFLTWAGER